MLSLSCLIQRINNSSPEVLKLQNVKISFVAVLPLSLLSSPPPTSTLQTPPLPLFSIIEICFQNPKLQACDSLHINSSIETITSVFQFILVMVLVSVSLPQSASGSPNMLQSSPSTYSRNGKLMRGICASRDISIIQSKDTTSGIPQYIVQIVNTCMSDCAPSHIHLNCEWFASARIVNPKTFKRLSYDDCLVNEGNPLKTSQIIRFTYSNSFMYPLSFKSARFC